MLSLPQTKGRRLWWLALAVVALLTATIANAVDEKFSSHYAPCGQRLDACGPDLALSPDLSRLIDSASHQYLLQQINQIAASSGGTYGVAVIELDSGASFGVNQHEWFQAASTVKAPILAYLYLQIQRGAISKDEMLTYTEADYEEGTGSIQYTEYGTQWSVAQLAEKMMKESDNAAKNMLIRRLGLSKIGEFINQRGPVFDLESNVTTPSSMASLLAQLSNDEIVAPALKDEMFELMTGTYNENGIPRYLNGVRVAHKTGSWGSSFSDAGIVFLKDRPFVLCVYSDSNPDVSQAEATIGAIALAVYNHEAGLAPAAR